MKIEIERVGEREREDLLALFISGVIWWIRFSPKRIVLLRGVI